MIENKITRLLLNTILLTVVSVLLFVPPLASMVLIFGSDLNLLGRNLGQGNILGLRISSDASDFGDKLRYIDEGFGGTVRTVGFVSKAGETVLYRDIFELENLTSHAQMYEIKILKVWGSNVVSKDVSLYFGENEKEPTLKLPPGQKATINLKIRNLNYPSEIDDFNFLKFVIF